MIWGYPYFRKPANRPCQSWNQQGPCSTTNGRPVPFTFLVGYFNAAIMGSSEWQKTGTEFVSVCQTKELRRYSYKELRRYSVRPSHFSWKGKIHTYMCVRMYLHIYTTFKKKCHECVRTCCASMKYMCAYTVQTYINIHCSLYVTTLCVVCVLCSALSINLYCAQQIFSYMLLIVLCIVSLMYIRVLPIDVYKL